jgi:hypothetical protein
MEFNDFNITALSMVLSLALTGYANWKTRQKHELGEKPLIPWGGVQFVTMMVFFIAAAHMVSLVTGEPFAGRSQF